MNSTAIKVAVMTSSLACHGLPWLEENRHTRQVEQQPVLDELVRHRPAGLDGLVAGIVGLREHCAGVVERRQPAGSLTMVRLSLGDRLAITALSDGHGAGRSYASFIAGFMPGFSATHYTGRQDCIQIYLTPRGVARILGVPGGQLARHVVDVADVVPQLGELFLEQLAAQPDWPTRFALLDGVLQALASRGRATDPLVDGLWHRIAASAGTVRIGALVEQSGWSHRRLVTRLRDHVGLSPKSAAAVVRFEYAVHELSAQEIPGGLAELAYRRGYSDQSHLTREVARYAGTSPGSLRGARVPTAWTALGYSPAQVISRSFSRTA
jgi:AraC-like DNA-binding protein